MYTTVVELLEKGALAKCPDKVALIEDERCITFSEMGNSAKSIAMEVIAKGISTNCCVAVVLKKGIDILVSDLAILYTGNYYTNIDVKSPPARLSHIFNNLEPAAYLANGETLDLLGRLGVDKRLIINLDDVPSQNSEECIEILETRYKSIIDTDPSCVMNTSGSTGIPKSCILNHRGLLDYAFWAFDALNLTGEDISGVIPAFYFDGYLTAFFNCLYNGATFVIAPDSIVPFPIKLAEYFAKYNITFIFWVPSVLVTFVATDILSKINLSSLKTICFAGEVFTTSHYNYWKKHITSATYVNLYGPIEISVICTYYIVNRDFKDDEPLPIGHPCRNTDIILLKDDNTEAKNGEQGEICVRGSSLALGYYNNPEKTSDVFVRNPLNNHYHELIYKTGDLGFYNEHGEIMFVGRKDFQIKHMGYRLELGEIEHLASAVDKIKHTCILYNKEKKEIVMFYEADSELSAGFIRTELGKSLPKYALPTVFHYMSELPRNANGKIDRQLLGSQI